MIHKKIGYIPRTSKEGPTHALSWSPFDFRVENDSFDARISCACGLKLGSNHLMEGMQAERTSMEGMETTGRTEVTFSRGYIPELIDDQRERARLFDVRMSDAMIQYEELREGLSALYREHGVALQAVRETQVQGECCVCLDDLGCASCVTHTTCGHIYHTRCLVETLAEGIVTSCPMCRKDIRELAGESLSGKVFKLMCVVRINADTVQGCTRMLKKEIALELDYCEQEARALQKWRMLSRLQKERRSVLKTKLLHLRTRLQHLEQFSEANIEGFQDIFRHIGFVLGHDMGDECVRECRTKMDIFRDFGTDGEYIQMATRLSTIIKYIGGLKAAVAQHEEKLREMRGLSSPTFSEASFARLSSCGSSSEHYDNKEGDEDVEASCFFQLTARTSSVAA